MKLLVMARKSSLSAIEDEAYKRRTAVDACGTVRRLNYKYTEDHKPDYVDWEERIWALIRIGILPKDAVKYMNKKN